MKDRKRLCAILNHQIPDRIPWIPRLEVWYNAHKQQNTLPYHQDLNQLLHQHSKWSAMHADADVSRILPHIERAGWDMVECLVTAPMAPLTIQQARRAWGDRVVIWGGIPSVLLSPTTSSHDFQEYVRTLFDTIVLGNSFILGVADNVMPDSLIERINWISGFVEDNGRLPLQRIGN